MLPLSNRHYWLLVILALVICYSASAQVGLKAGLGFSDIVFSDEGQAPYLGYETDYLTHRYPLPSFQVGLSAVAPLNRRFDFLGELLFVSQGMKYDMYFIYDHIKNRAFIYYLQVPALFRCKFALEKKHQPNLFLGPYLGLKLWSKRIKTYDGINETSKVENARPIDFGLIGGFGYDFKLEKGTLTSELRFGYSLVDMMDTLDGYIHENDIPGSLKARNLSLSLLVGWRFSTLFTKRNNT
jgi:hypothetical protein